MRTPQPVKDFGAAVSELEGLLGKQPPPTYCEGCGCWNRGKCTQGSTPEVCAAQDEADRRHASGEVS